MSKQVTSNEAEIKERKKALIDFCKRHELVRERMYAGELLMVPDDSVLLDMFDIKKRSLESYWKGDRVVPMYVINIMNLHDGKIERLCDKKEN